MNMINSLLTATYGTLFTFFCTVAGASAVFLERKNKVCPSKRALRLCFGFASGVMMAASVWSLLLPAMESAEAQGQHPVVTSGVGFLLGGLLIWLIDRKTEKMLRARFASDQDQKASRKRTAMLMIAMTMHNIPEGMAVGLSFALASAHGDMGAMASAMALALGIGLQNLPEGTAISLPMRQSGLSRWHSFGLGSVSGAVEPIFGIASVFLAEKVQTAMPWLLSAAAGAMIFVVASELIPESAEDDPFHFGAIGVMLGFAAMMVMDVALG